MNEGMCEVSNTKSTAATYRRDWVLEKSLRVVRDGYARNEHKNLGDDSKPPEVLEVRIGSDYRKRKKAWTRKELELEANRILGEAPLDLECNYIPEADRTTYNVYELKEKYQRSVAIWGMEDDVEHWENVFGSAEDTSEDASL